jgi:hypothetical protein
MVLTQQFEVVAVTPAAIGYFAWGCFRHLMGTSDQSPPEGSGMHQNLGSGGLDGGRTRDRTLDLSRVKGTLSR